MRRVTSAPDSVPTSTSVTLAEIVDDAGHTLLHPAFLDQDLSREVDGLVIHDATDVAPWPSKPLVLAVGVQTLDQLRQLSDQVARRGPGAVIVRHEVVEEVDGSSVGLASPVLALKAETSWMQVAAAVAPLISGRVTNRPVPPQLGGVPSGDLFALANAIAEVLDAPVTVEDRDSRVLAFSIRQEEADPSRVGAILNRQVTHWATQDLQ